MAGFDANIGETRNGGASATASRDLNGRRVAPPTGQPIAPGVSANLDTSAAGLAAASFMLTTATPFAAQAAAAQPALQPATGNAGDSPVDAPAAPSSREGTVSDPMAPGGVGAPGGALAVSLPPVGLPTPTVQGNAQETASAPVPHASTGAGLAGTDDGDVVRQVPAAAPSAPPPPSPSAASPAGIHQSFDPWTTIDPALLAQFAPKGALNDAFSVDRSAFLAAQEAFRAEAAEVFTQLVFEQWAVEADVVRAWRDAGGALSVSDLSAARTVALGDVQEEIIDMVAHPGSLGIFGGFSLLDSLIPEDGAPLSADVVGVAAATGDNPLSLGTVESVGYRSHSADILSAQALFSAQAEGVGAGAVADTGANVSGADFVFIAKYDETIATGNGQVENYSGTVVHAVNFPGFDLFGGPIVSGMLLGGDFGSAHLLHALRPGVQLTRFGDLNDLPSNAVAAFNNNTSSEGPFGEIASGGVATTNATENFALALGSTSTDFF